MVKNQDQTDLVTRHAEWFGIRRPLTVAPLERHVIQAADGAILHLHHASGGRGGPVLLAPGTAMSALSYCIDTVEQNFVEYLVAQGFDVWLFDWRTSPELAVHRTTYTLDTVARYDWPAAVATVRQRTGADKVAIFAHCLSSVALHLSLVRGYLAGKDVARIVASQIGLHLVFNWVGRLRSWTYVDKLIAPNTILHSRPEEVTSSAGDTLVSLMAPIIPKSYPGDNRACHRHSVMFGDLLHIQHVNAKTVELMGSLIPEVTMSFLRDAVSMSRGKYSCALTSEDKRHLDRLALPIVYVVGSQNNMFVPESTRRTYELLSAYNGPAHYRHIIIEGYGHLDCLVGDTANRDTFPIFVRALTGEH